MHNKGIQVVILDDRQMDDGTYVRVDKCAQMEKETPSVKDKCTTYELVDKFTQMEKETPSVIDKCTQIVDPLSKNDKQHISNADISVQIADLRNEILSLKQQLTKGRQHTIKKRRHLKRKMKTKKYKRIIRRCVKRNTVDNPSFISNRCPYNEVLMEDLYQKYLISRKIKERNESRKPTTDGHFPLLYKKTQLFDILGIKDIPPQTHSSKMEFWPSEVNVSPPRSLDQYFRNSSLNEAQSSEQYSRSMNIEMLRLETFRHFPLASKARPIRLAKAGFFYTGNDDRVECYSCGIIYRNWTENEDPREVHRRISPMCQHVQNQDQNNVPIHVENATLLSNAGQTTVPPSEHASGSTTIQTQTTSSGVMSSMDRNDISMPSSDMRTQGPQIGSQHSVTENSSHGRPTLHSNVPATMETSLSQGSTSIPNHEASNGNQNNERTGSQPHRNELIRSLSNNANGQMFRRDAMIQKLNPLGITFDKPRYPTYAVITVRISSFQNWPSNMTQTPRELAYAGFLYAGYADNVRCFFCGGGLRNWEAGDDPWIEHARWFPRCTFLRQNKGDEFVALVQDQHMKEQSKRTEKRMNINGSTKSALRTSRHIKEKQEKLIDSAAVRSVMEMGYTEAQVSEALNKRDALGKGQLDLTAQDILDILMEEASVGNHTEAAGATTSPPGPSYESRSLMEENQRLKDQRLCKVCLDKEANIAMLPCGHLCCCPECAPAMRKCPICRAFVKGTVRTWLA